KNLAVNNLYIITGKINEQGCGPFSLTGQPNAMGGREVGGLSTTLAAHMDYTPENCKRVSAFWNSNCLPSKPGLTAFEMIEAADNHALDILIICHTDPVYHLPDRHFVEKAMKNISLVVEINAYKGSETSSFSHIRIPALPFGYKEGTQTNMDRTLTRVVPFAPKGELLQDWEIFSKLGRALGYEQAFDFTTTKTVFEEYQAMTKLSPNRHLNIYEADYDLLANKPFVWGETLFKDNRFMTDDGRVRVYSVTNLERSEQPDQSYPFLLLTGRTRDQWHSGSKTAQVKSLLKHKPLTFIEINPDDAKTLGLTEEDEVIIFSKRGKLTAKVKYANINPKTVFIPLSHKDVNYLTPGILDPQSKEPDYNHTAVRIEKV
ncbi:molybdopterin oxidoreductase family protein, partial [Sulfurovum sp.]|uniref:molybdopterin oxidoreductase family protein n=1 Tax=Sulfurovum sp. TaxID=1969726 RepID=UPI0025E454BA